MSHDKWEDFNQQRLNLFQARSITSTGKVHVSADNLFFKHRN